MDEFGIGRVPADVDPVRELMAEAEAARIQRRREIIACPNCGSPTTRGNLMNASLGTACPECFDSLSD